MRIFLIFLVLLALFATLWHALFKGSPLPYLQGAPQIEQRIHRAALDVMTEIGGYPVEIRTRGRDVVLTGPVESAEKRDQLVARIGALPLVRSLTNDLTVLDMAIPFTLEIVKAPDGAVAVRGHVPSRRVEDRLMAEARDAGGTAGATFELKLAAGAPEGDWWGMVSTGLRALSVLNHGRLAISGADAALSGEAPDAEAEARVAEVVDGAPMGNWMQDISAARPPGGFLFLVTMPPEGDLTVEGNAPDEATERRLLAMAAATTGRAASGSLHLANGMPGSDWPRLAMAGLTALAAAEAGTLELRDRQVRLQATVDTDADKAALEALMDEDWEAVINVRNPTPPGSVRITLGDGGKLVVDPDEERHAARQRVACGDRGLPPLAPDGRTDRSTRLADSTAGIRLAGGRRTSGRGRSRRAAPQDSGTPSGQRQPRGPARVHRAEGATRVLNHSNGGPGSRGGRS